MSRGGVLEEHAAQAILSQAILSQEAYGICAFDFAN